MLVFRRQSRSTGHRRCDGPQNYSMPTDVYIYFLKQVFGGNIVTLHTVSKVKRINRGDVTLIIQ